MYLGIRKLREPDRAAALPERAPRGAATLWRQAVVVNLLNPKSALFFLAFLPQFVRPGAGSTVAQILVLGGTFLVLSLITDGAYVLLAARAGGWLRRRLSASARARRAQRYVVGGTYIGLGAVAALAGRSTK